MKTVFIDASVLFSACRSKIGISTLVFAYCRKQKVLGYVSPDVIAEVKKNISLENQLVKQRLNTFLLQGKLKIIVPLQNEIERYANIIVSKDAHVLAAAIKCKADYLLTFDKKDFKQPKVREFMKPIKIVTPRKFLRIEDLV